MAKQKNMNVVLDLGANVECDEKNLVDFSEMGAALYKALISRRYTKSCIIKYWI